MKKTINHVSGFEHDVNGSLFLQRNMTARAFAFGFIRVLMLALILCAPARLLADHITVTVTVDNGYGFGFGDTNGIFPAQYYGGIDNCEAQGIFGNCYVFVPPENPITNPGPEIYNITADWTNYLYIVVWSDDASDQGAAATFTDNDTGSTVTTSPAWPWQVYATGTNWSPNCGAGQHGPPVTGFTYAINNQIAVANAAAGGVGTSKTWVGNTATPNGRLDFSGQFNGNAYPYAVPSCIPSNPEWMEYNPEPNNPACNPFVWGSVTDYSTTKNFLREYLIYRVGSVGQLFTTTNTCTNGCITIINPNNITAFTCSNSVPVPFIVHVIDNCCTNYTLTTVPASGANFPVGTTTVTSTVTDTCGNTNSCTFTVTVIQDTNAPIITACPANFILCGTNGCGAMPDVTSQLVATTAYGSTNVVVTQSIPAGTVLCSSTNVILTVSDACGDATNCTVPCILSTNPPIITFCPPDIIICTNSGAGGTNVSSGCGTMPYVAYQVQATGALSGVTIASITQSILQGTIICSDTDVTFTVTDTCGNSTNCTVPVNLIDCSSNCLNIECWTNIVVTSCTNLPVDYYPSATDSCCSNWFSYCNPPSGSIFNVGTTTTVSFTALDICGNSNGCSFTVTVLPGTNCTGCLQLLTENLFEADWNSGNIYEFTPTGTRSTYATGLSYPDGLAFDAAGNLYVACQGSGQNIVKIAPNGAQSVFASGLTTPNQLAFDSNGNLFAGEGGSPGDILKFTPSGAQSTFASNANASGLAFDTAGNLFATEFSKNQIDKFTPAAVQSVFTSGVNGPEYLAFDSSGNLFVGSWLDGTIVKLTPSAAQSTFATGVQSPWGLAFDGSGNLFEADFGSGNIYEFAPNGSRSTFATGLSPSALAFQPVPVVGNPPNIVVTSCTNIPVVYSLSVTDNCCTNWTVIYDPPSGSNFLPNTTNTVIVSAWDSCGNTNSWSFTVTVLQGTNCTNCCPITLGPGTLASGTAGVPYSQTITANSDCNPLILYSTTDLGGVDGDGTVFSVTPNGVLSSLAYFNGSANGVHPQAGLVLGNDGNFYGTTLQGGVNNDGTIYKMTPGGALTTLHFFNNFDGYQSTGGLIQGSDGNFYGTTAGGGSAGEGTVFKITPAGVLTTLVSFYGANGTSPDAALVLGSDGNFYGTTAGGGSGGEGTVFKITPSGTLTTLASFNGANGTSPEAGLVQGSDGNFYGTTLDGGSANQGTVFKITPAGILTTLVSFTGSGSVGYPVGGLIQGSDGNFYGTTAGNTSVGGTIFKMTPSGALTTLVSFNGTDGSTPAASLVQGSDGNFYGTTQTGGSSGFDGTVFKMTPAGALTTLVNFTGADGEWPVEPLVPYNTPYTFVVTGGSLPPGLTLSSSGALSGTPTASGVFCFTVTAIDANGCTGSTNYCITNTCLALYCTNLTAYTCGSCTNVSLADAVTYSDPCCTNVSLQFFEGTTAISPTTTCFPFNTITPVTVVATDACGNTAANVFNVTVLPGAACTNGCITIHSTNIVVNAPCGSDCVMVPFTATAIDNCCSNVILQYYLGTTFVSAEDICFPTNTTTTVTVMATDDCGNIATTNFTVTVLPSTNCTGCLQVQCPSNIVVNTCSNCVMVNFAATVTDPCCSNGLQVSYSPNTNSCFPVGTNLVTVTASDICGNTDTCSFTVTVNQYDCPPVITVGPTNFILCSGPGGCATMPDEVHDASPIHYALFNTGVSPFTGEPLPPGTSADPHWTLASVPTVPTSSPLEFGTNTQLQVNTIPGWLDVDNLSAWIAPANDANNDGPEGDYDYQTTFMLPSGTSISISGQLAVDDSVVEILLNGASTGVSITNGAASAEWNPFTLAGVGLAGSNTLDFIVHNNPLIGTNPPADNLDTPTGLMVEFNTLETQLPLVIPAAVQATNCDGSASAGWQSIPPNTTLCASTNITFVFSNACGETTSYTATITVEPCCTPPPPRMVLWLTFDETAGITCLNSAGYNNGNRYEGNNFATRLNGPSHIVGQYVNNSLSFDGSGDKVIVPNYSAIDFSNNNFSMDAWVKWSNSPASETLVDHRAGPVPHPVGYEWFIAAGRPGLQLDNGAAHTFTAANPIPTNVWVHLAATVQRGSASGLKLYTNGAVSDTFNIAAINGSLFNQVDLWVGAPEEPLNNLFSGGMDELELFNQTLTVAEIDQIYDAGRAGKCRPTCSVPAVTTVCPGTTNVVVTVEVCNCGSSTSTLNVSFTGLTAAQAGGSPAINDTGGFSQYPSSVTLGPDACTNFTVNVAIPAAMTSSKVIYYQMVIKDGLGQQFSSIGEINDPLTIYSYNCFPYINPSTNHIIITRATNVIYVINNPTNAVLNLTSIVFVLNQNLQPDTNLVSLNGQIPGTPATNQLTFGPYESLPVSVNVNYVDSQPWTPYYLVLMLNVGPDGGFVPVASTTIAQVVPPTVGPVVSANVTNNQVIVSWDVVNPGWTLQSSTNLGGTNWVPVNLPVLPLLDGSQGVTAPATNRARFYQLTGPGSP